MGNPKPYVNCIPRGATTAHRSAKILLRDGDWTIVELEFAPDTPGFRSKRSRYSSLVKHVCYPDGYKGGSPYPEKGSDCVHQVVVYPDDSSRCWRCEAKIPEGMIAVWKFQNWERLAYGG